MKKKLARAINELLEPIREKRKFYEDRPDDVRSILHEGTRRAREVAAQRNMDEIISKMASSSS
ncbi:MAG: hypothetical protein R3B51_13270 [Thermodesulfobacteriota bacterium]